MTTPATGRKTIALVAHDNMKADLVQWAVYNRRPLAAHDLWATGTTGMLLEDKLGVPISKLQSGPLGGDQQLGAMIAAGAVDALVFFWDPLEPQPHDPDVKALLRIAVVWNIPVACNRATADFMISSALMAGEYKRLVPNYDDYRARVTTPMRGPLFTMPEEPDAAGIDPIDHEDDPADPAGDR